MTDQKFRRIFLSHSSQDAGFAILLAHEIEQYLGDGFRVFASTRPDAIPPGKKWRDIIVGQIQESEALVVLLTPASAVSHWIPWEAGYFEAKQNAERIFVLARETANVPPPLSQFQAKLVTNSGELQSFFETMAAELGVQPATSLNTDSLIAEAKSLGAKPPERSMRHFLYLVDTAEWDSFETDLRRIYVCQDDMLFQVQIDYSDDDNKFDEPWVRKFPDPVARRFFVNMMIAGQIIAQFPFISLDGGRYFVPLPRSYTTKSKETVRYSWERDSPDFRLFRVVGKLYHVHQTIEELAHYAGITLIGSLGE